MTKDSLLTSHAISTPIIHPDDITQFFDSISYDKVRSPKSPPPPPTHTLILCLSLKVHAPAIYQAAVYRVPQMEAVICPSGTIKEALVSHAHLRFHTFSPALAHGPGTSCHVWPWLREVFLFRRLKTNWKCLNSINLRSRYEYEYDKMITFLWFRVEMHMYILSNIV